MTALHLNLYAQVGPDHHFLVVPAIGECLFLIAKGGLWARRGPAECSSLGLVAPTTLIVGSSLTWPSGPFPLVYRPVPFAPHDLLTSVCLSARCRCTPVVVNPFFFRGCRASRLQRFVLVPASLPLFSSHS